jgi:hypothetical protein
MNVSEMLLDVYSTMGMPASTAITSEDAKRILRHFNKAHRDILRKAHFERYRRKLLTVASVASSPFMAIPYAISSVKTLQDRTNDWFLQEKSLQWIRSMDPGLRSTQANPWAYSFYDLMSPVAKQPSDASQLLVKSTAAGDGAGMKAHAQLVSSNGTLQTTSVDLNGTTAVNIGGTTTVAVNKFYVYRSGGSPTTPAGDITLHEDTGAGTELAFIPAGKSFSRYSMVHLFPTPSAIVTYHADVEVVVVDLAEASDEPLIPEDFHELLVIRAKQYEYEKKEKDKLMAAMEVKWRQGLRDFYSHTERPTGHTGGDDSRRYSQLGPFFEPGT